MASEPKPSVLRAALSAAFRFDWTAAHPLAAVYCLPGILVPLAAGEALGARVDGLVGASGALIVGFGAFQRLTRLRAGPMLLAAFGASLSAFIGTLVSGVPVLEAVAAGLWGAALGVFTALGTASWWVLLQCAIALVIATTFPADLHGAAERALLILGGAAVQVAIVSALWAIAPGPFRGMRPPSEEPPPHSLYEASLLLAPGGKLTPARLRYCAGVGLSAAAGIALFRALDFPNGYWIPMTVLLVLRWGGLHLTLGRALARCTGTLIGVGLVTLATAAIRPSPAALIALGLLAAWYCYALQWVNYAAFTVGITAFVVFGFALAGLPEPVVAAHRAVATLIGGGLAVLGQVILRAFGPNTG